MKTIQNSGLNFLQMTEEELSLTEKSIKDVKTGIKLYVDKEICEIIDEIEANEKINYLKGLTIRQLEEEKDEKVKKRQSEICSQISNQRFKTHNLIYL